MGALEPRDRLVVAAEHVRGRGQAARASGASSAAYCASACAQRLVCLEPRPFRAGLTAPLQLVLPGPARGAPLPVER